MPCSFDYYIYYTASIYNKKTWTITYDLQTILYLCGVPEYKKHAYQPHKTCTLLDGQYAYSADDGADGLVVLQCWHEG